MYLFIYLLLLIFNIPYIVYCNDQSAAASNLWKCPRADYGFLLPVAEGTKDRHCSASLIQSSYALTSTNCVDKPGAQYLVYVHRLNGSEPVRVREVHIVPRMEDIAILELDKPAEGGEFVWFGMLADFVDHPGMPPCTDASIVGFLKNDINEDIMRCTNVTLYDHETCKSQFHDIEMDDDQVCIKITDTLNEHDPCKENLGAALVCDYYIIGVVTRIFRFENEPNDVKPCVMTITKHSLGYVIDYMMGDKEEGRSLGETISISNILWLVVCCDILLFI